MTARIRHAALLVLVFVFATGCANIIRTGLFNSNSVMLPLTNADFTIYIQTSNISENQQVSLTSLPIRLSGKGYKVVNDPAAAYCWLQARVVYCHKAKNGITAETVALTGFGSGIGTGGSPIININSMMGGDNGEGGQKPPDINAMMSKVMAMAGSAMPGMWAPPPEGVLYLCVADVQITERGKGRAKTAKPSATVPSEYRMRTVAHVLQKKLNIEEVTPIIQAKLNAGIAGMF